jgi:hypothetical protein
MPKVSFGSDMDSAFELKPSDDLIAVRTRSRRSLRAGPVMPAAAAGLSGGNLVLAFPDAGVEVYRVPAADASLEKKKEVIRKDPDVKFAGGVLVDDIGEPVLYTENFFLKFKDDVAPETCKEVIADNHLTIKRELDYAKNAFFLAAPDGTGQKVFEIAERLLQRPDVEYCHPELIRRKARRAISPRQWHLMQTVINGVTIKAHANVKEAHTRTRGEGMLIAVIDDGVDVDHPEFNTSGKVVAPRDVAFPLDDPRGRDPRPKTSADNHGTACAGVASAAGLIGASGVAPAAKLMPIRLAAGLGSMEEADAFRWAADNGADVISCSWGPPDGDWFDPDDPLHHHRVPLPPATRLAIDHARTHGRGGRGCVILFAAGNGNESVDNDGYASYEGVIAVAACNDRGLRSVYSDFGKAVWCAFPSSDFSFDAENRPEPLTTGIWTTDRLATRGYNPGVPEEGDLGGNFTNSFGGTSSACPGAAGVVALMLTTNPDLKSADVKTLLQRSCEKIDPSNAGYDAKGHSLLYGFGRLDAVRAIEAAKPAPKPALLVSKIFNRRLLDFQQVEAALDITEVSPVNELAVNIELRHTFIGDLVLKLVPPNGGLPIVLHDRRGGSANNLRVTYDASNTPDLAVFRNSSCRGKWSLLVHDRAKDDVGVLVRFGLELRFQGTGP